MRKRREKRLNDFLVNTSLGEKETHTQQLESMTTAEN